MAYLNYLLVSIISYLGLGFGAFLYLIAPEEYKPGRKHINALKHIIMIATLALMLIIEANIFTIIVAAVSLIAYALSKRFSYALFAALFFIFYTIDALNLGGVLLFLFGLTEGTLITGAMQEHYQKKKSKKEKVSKPVFVMGLLASRSYFFVTLILPLVLLKF